MSKRAVGVRHVGESGTDGGVALSSRPLIVGKVIVMQKRRYWLGGLMVVAVVSIGFGLSSRIASAVPPAPPKTASFTLFIYETAEDFALRDDTTAKGAAYWKSWMDYREAMIKAGIIKGGMPLPSPDQSKQVSLDGGKASVKNGPVNSSDKFISGYFMIDVENLEAAVEWAKKAPNTATGAVEIRAMYSAPGMNLSK